MTHDPFKFLLLCSMKFMALWMSCIQPILPLWAGCDIMVRVLVNGLGDWGSIPGRVIQKIQKWYLMPPYLTLSNIRYRSKVSGAIQGKEYCPPLHLSVVVIEKGVVGSPLTMVGQLTTYLNSVFFLLPDQLPCQG